MKLKYFLKEFEWMKIYFSPFKPPVPKIYIGKTAIGTPYFLPRKWVKATPERAHKATLEYIKSTEEFNKRNPEYARKVLPYDQIFSDKMKSSYAVPKKIGFDFVGLGWKTKWTSTDYRFEWSPVWSFVFFGYQIAITFVPIEPHHYWECWLYYSRETVGSPEKRLKKSRKKFPCVWSSTRDGVKTTTCYWDVILKKKYL
jgi:hypothetical protein